MQPLDGKVDIVFGKISNGNEKQLSQNDDPKVVIELGKDNDFK